MKKILLSALAVLATIPVSAQWTSNSAENTQLTNRYVQDWEVEPLSDGSTVIYYTYPERIAIGEDTVFGMKHYLVLYDKNGNSVWDSPLLVCHAPNRSFTMVNKYLFVDVDDNIMLSIPDTRYDTSGLLIAGEPWYGMNLTLYKINKNGEFLWGSDGIVIDKNPHYLVAQAYAVGLENGSIIVSWSQMETSSSSLRTKLARISSAGEKIWEKNLDPAGADATVVNGGNNEFIVVYTYGGTSAICAQKLDFNGDEVWGHTVIYNSGGYNAAPVHTWLKVLPVERGAFISWMDDRDNNRFEDAYCSYINKDGQLLSTGTDGVKLGYTENTRKFSPVGAYDADGKFVYYVWRETSSEQSWSRIVAQKVSLNGELIWESNGIEIAPYLQRPASYANVQMGTDGNVCFFYQQQTNYQADYAGIAQYRSANGDSLWNIVFSHVEGGDGRNYSQASLKVLPCYNDQWIAVWDDNRPDANSLDNSSAYGQNIRIDGVLGEGGTSTEKPVSAIKTTNFRVSSNPVSDDVEFTVSNLRGANVDITIVNPLGKQVSRVFNGRLSSDNQTFSWNVNVTKGIYLAVLKNGSKTETIKLIIK
ncbi:MAG: T9SS type A sorting domain-containing protein [Bacteroidales bacterium]|jgi:hypothetical protein|nr:T9SS type A sorting domain-containing protein [Bacteroidales bacterium]